MHTLTNRIKYGAYVFMISPTETNIDDVSLSNALDNLKNKINKIPDISIHSQIKLYVNEMITFNSTRKKKQISAIICGYLINGTDTVTDQVAGDLKNSLIEMLEYRDLSKIEPLYYNVIKNHYE